MAGEKRTTSTAPAAPPGPLAVFGAALLLLAFALAAFEALRWPTPAVAPAARPLDRAEVTPAVASRDELARFLQDHPDHGRGWLMLGQMDLDAERYADAAAAFEQAVQASPKVASDPTVWCWWADALAMAQGRRLEGRPTELVERALALRADHPMALDMAGSAAYERGDYVKAVHYWRQLLPQLPAGTAPHRDLQAAIARAARLAPAAAARPAAAASR